MPRRRPLLALIATAALACSLVVANSPVATAHPGPPAPARPAPLYPAVGAGTHLINEDAKLAGFNDTAWYKANIPFLDVPDQQIEQVYYYRWRDYKEHLRYTDPTDGWISTEFLDCCGYAAPYQAIDAAAGHQISEGRWLRDQQYTDDYIKFWLTGPGAGPKPQTDADNADTSDWAHEYSFWLASAAYGQAEVTGDTTFITALLPQLITQWQGWDKQFNPAIGLYWSVPVWDAMEYSASSYASSDPYHGGAGYRPTLNSYQYGDAMAISKIAALAGQPRIARSFAAKAKALGAAMQKYLYDPKSAFYYHVARDNNPQLTKLATREEIGFIPWAFDAAEPNDAAAWAQLFDPQGFAAPFGPTTAERRSPLFNHDAGGCCRWDGPSWPFATAQTLTGMANLLDDYPAQPYVTAQQYAAQLHTYAATQYKNGKPYVAEAHSADQDQWIYDGYDHSEDYNHSTYADLVINGLLGLRPSTGDALSIKPLVPAGWDHFALENVPYHGHNVTVAYDRDGSHYGIGTGMRVFIDGRQVLARPGVQSVSVHVGADRAQQRANLVNDAANPLRTGYPQPITSYTWQYDNAWNALDGKVWFNEVPENTRWTNYASPNAQDFYGVDFGVPTKISDIRWYGYDDGGGVRPAAGYQLQYWTGSVWADVPSQHRDSTTPVGNGLNRITFPPLTTTKVRLLFTNAPGAYVGVTEFQSWSVSDPAATVAIKAGQLSGPTAVPVTVTDTGRRPLLAGSVSVAVPPGWTVSPAVATLPVVRPGRPATVTVTVTPAGPPGTVSDLVATASYRQPPGRPSSSHTRQQVRIAYPVGPASPVGQWDFDEGSGSTAHDATSQHDLSLQNGPQWTTGQSGSALQYNGSDQDAVAAGPILDTTGNFTVSAWVKLDSTANFATAVSQDGGTTSGFFLQYSAADQRFAFSTGEGRALADQPPVTGSWYHLVGVHDANSGSYTLYVNGVRQQSVWQQPAGDAAPGPFVVGRAFSGGHPSDFWPGAIDQVQVWQRALPAAEVAKL
ncbi:MAG TPA: LamG-like jellyroll fold domain-containing protein [Jatrophihabitans sp.]|nr:LamG-like jellyroll fold domain-containing protein [Jatrophihabitans sp.]